MVDKQGFTHNHEVIKGVNEQLDTEALRICKLIKFDYPAKQLGEPVNLIYYQRIKFEPKDTPISNKKTLNFFTIVY